MSFMHNKSTFLEYGALIPASSFEELDIPPHPLGGGNHKAQPYNFAPGSQFAIFDLNRQRVAYCAVLSRGSYGLGGEKFMVQNVSTNETTFLSDWQVSILEREWRLVPTNSAGQRGAKFTKPSEIKNYLAMPANTRKAAIRRWWYARTLSKASQGGQVELTRKVVMKTAKGYAKSKGEAKPPCYNSLMSEVARENCTARISGISA